MMMYRRICLVVALAICLGSANLTLAGGGTLKGKFVYGGEAPKAAAVDVNADKAFCGKHGLVNESLVVGKDGALGNVIIYLYLSRGDTVKVDPAYDALKAKAVRLNNENCRFSPHVGLLWTEQTIVLANKDTVGHNMKVDARNKPMNALIPAGGELPTKFEEAERLPVQVGCNIHPWMRGWLVIRDNPYFAVTGADGSFEIKNIPAGDWQFQVWHEQAGYVREVKIGGKDVEWSRGRVEVSVKEAGTVDLGTVTVPESLFEE